MNEQFFQQIDLVFPKFSIEQLKFQSNTDSNHPLLHYYNIVDDNILKCIKNILPFPVASDKDIRYAEITGTILPHRDKGGTCVINHYFETNDSDVTFYKGKETILLKPLPGSTWILNVKEYHSVTPKSNGVRRFLSIGYPTMSYEELINEVVKKPHLITV
jgi:hypothetical protein